MGEKGGKSLYLIGGPMGVGKTSVCQHLKQELPRSVFLDGDWCWDADPFVVNRETKTMVMDNIAHLLNSFIRCSAYDNILFAWVMDEQATIDTLLIGLDTTMCRIRSISLLADAKTLEERLGKDITRGLRDEGVVARSLEKLPRYFSLDTVKIDTVGKSVEEIAEEVKGI